MVSLQQIERGAIKYIDNDLAPKIPINVPNGQLKKIAAISGAVYAIRHGLQRLVTHPALESIGAIDDNGDIDVEGIISVVREQIPQSGFKLTVPILGDLTFFQEDIERLRVYIMEE